MSESLSNIMTHRPFRTVLIANRGEIALRIIRTAKRMGYFTVAVFSQADAQSPHVFAADKAICIGPAPAGASYLNQAALVQAALDSGAQAIHPGYGFLAENAQFAQSVLDAGLIFVGPPPAAIQAMGNKGEAKRLAMAAGMPCIPGYQSASLDRVADDATLIDQANRIGYPIMVKAAAGGGGRGMRLVHDAAALPDALASARSEALAGFGSDELILERAVLRARHIEIQILADSLGHVVHLGERDCSVQRRHQKIIEESPSVAVDAALRERMGQAAVQGAKAIGYVGAGTMEFLLDEAGAFYFMEMNTRLQVEHAVTEALTGLDLVEWQLRVASGEALNFAQSDVTFTGHAMEVRLTAEDVSAGFLPQTGQVQLWQTPSAALAPQASLGCVTPANNINSFVSDGGVRIDHALCSGSWVSPHYDSMVAKVIVHGDTREQVLRKLDHTLAHTVLLGLPTNHGFLRDCINHPVFALGKEVHTGFVAEQFGAMPAAGVLPERTVALAALAWMMDGQASRAAVVTLGHAQSSWLWSYTADASGVKLTGLHQATQQQKVFALQDLRIASNRLTVRLNQGFEQAWFAIADDTVHVFHEGRAWMLERLPEQGLRKHTATQHIASGTVVAPLGAKVIKVAVALNERVVQGQTLMVLEAMKMEHAVSAPMDGVVSELLLGAGHQTRKGDVLLRITPSHATS